MVYRPVTDQRIVYRVPDYSESGYHSCVFDLYSHYVGKKEEIEQILEVKNHVAGRGEGAETQLFHKPDFRGFDVFAVSPHSKSSFL